MGPFVVAAKKVVKDGQPYNPPIPMPPKVSAPITIPSKINELKK